MKFCCLSVFRHTAWRKIIFYQTRISEILKGKRRITADTAGRFSRFFGTSAKFWLGLQDRYDLEEERLQKSKELDGIKPIQRNAA